MGRWKWRVRPHLWKAVACMGRNWWKAYWPTIKSNQKHQAKPQLQKAYSQCLECLSIGRYGPAALPHTISCQLYQRSADVFLGVPFNIASYALLTCMVAQICRLQVGEFIHTLGDAHLYLNHLEQAELQLTRNYRPSPTLWLNDSIQDIDSFRYADIKINNYDPHPTIKAPISI